MGPQPNLVPNQASAQGQRECRTPLSPVTGFGAFPLKLRIAQVRSPAQALNPVCVSSSTQGVELSINVGCRQEPRIAALELFSRESPC